MDASAGIEEEFNAAASCVASFASAGEIPDSELLKLYGLYKQGTEGQCVGKKPSIFDIKGRSKYFAWVELGDMSQEEAQSRYIDLLSELKPNWNQAKARSSQGVGPVFSSLEMMLEDDHQAVDRIPDLIRATQNGDINEIRSLLDTGHNVDIRDSDNCTPLHWAADKGNLEIIKLLIDRGACVNAQDIDGMTPIEYAELADQEEAKHLIKQASCQQSAIGD